MSFNSVGVSPVGISVAIWSPGFGFIISYRNDTRCYYSTDKLRRNPSHSVAGGPESVGYLECLIIEDADTLFEGVGPIEVDPEPAGVGSSCDFRDRTLSA